MRKLKIGIIDLVAKAPTKAFWDRVMNPNFASIMPQVIATWCEENGHSVSVVCYTGGENLLDDIPEEVDILFISSFTHAAHLAYALSNMFRARGAVTVIGGPHARCYPDDAKKYFDYVLGFTDETLILDVLADCQRHRPEGVCLSAGQHPNNLPGVARRWKFIEQTLKKAPFIKIVPLISSLGCPYSCEFCIDSSVKYQPLDVEAIKQDLRFLLGKIRRPRVGWHDPSYGIRFDDSLEAIEEAVPPDRIDFIAETPLSLLTESRVERLKKNGFKALLPGIESWYDLGNKSKTRTVTGIEKVRQVSEHVNMILRYIPYVQTNFIFGLDVDSGPEPYRLTKQFLDLTPGAFPAYSLMSAFGQAAPANLEYQRANRVLPFPFHSLDNNGAMNVRPLNYTWPQMYDHIIDVTEHSFSRRMILRRFAATRGWIPRWLHVIRAVSLEGFGRIRYFKEVRRLLDVDARFRSFFDQETTDVPEFFIQRIRRGLGAFIKWLPEGALYHNPNAYYEAARSREDQFITGLSYSGEPLDARKEKRGLNSLRIPGIPSARHETTKPVNNGGGMRNADLPAEIQKINNDLLNSEIRTFQQPNRAKSVWQLCNTLIPYLALATLSYFALRISFWLALPLILISSGFMIRTFIIFHDCGHQSFFRSPKANRFWGVITGFLTFTPYYYWKSNHDRHHDTSGNLDKRGFGDVWTMTVSEYAGASRRDRMKYRLYRNPLVMFFLGPLLIILVSYRIPGGKVDKKERNSVYLTNISIIIFAVAMSLMIGTLNYLIIQILILYIGLICGVWLFYVQHQFEDVYWARGEEWNFIEASLKGGSFYKLPKILNWFTGNIGYHHVHHLLTGIPNYNLPACHGETPIKDVVKPTRFFISLKSLKYRLWDENNGRLVGYKEARRGRREHGYA